MTAKRKKRMVVPGADKKVVGSFKEYTVMATPTEHLTALKLNVPSLLYYFSFKFSQKTGGPYPMRSINWAKMGLELKRGVLDELIFRQWGVNEMKAFIDYVFAKKPKEKWAPNMLKFFLPDWLTSLPIVKQSGVNAGVDNSIETLRTRRLEEKQLLEYIGQGYFDTDLTKLQYWLGRHWRLRHLTKTALEKLEARKFRLDPVAVQRLEQWDAEMPSKERFLARRAFCVELARTAQKSTIREALAYFKRQEWEGEFTPEELDNSVLDNIPVVI